MSKFFFFKQKTAYEMLRSLVGSEMCIRDRHRVGLPVAVGKKGFRLDEDAFPVLLIQYEFSRIFCLLYTSDAADDLLCVDLGGRRYIQKKMKQSSIYNLVQYFSAHMSQTLPSDTTLVISVTVNLYT